MPLKDTHLIDFKTDQVELIAELIHTERDDPRFLQTEITKKIFEHQLELMTDHALLDPVELQAITSFVSRDPVGEPIGQVFEHLRFTQVSQTNKNQKQSGGWIGRFASKKNKRAQIAKWSLHYLRTADLDPQLHQLESYLEMSLDGLNRDEQAHALRDGLSKHMKTRIGSFDVDGIQELEQTLIKARGKPEKPWILLPSMVTCITSFVAKSIQAHATNTRWDESEDDQPLYVQSGGGPIVRTDPALRVVRFINSGTKALLSEYAKHVIRQSLTPSV